MNTHKEHRHSHLITQLLVSLTLIVSVWAGAAWQMDALDQWGPARTTAAALESAQGKIEGAVEQVNWRVAQFHSELKHAYMHGFMY